MKSWRAPPMAYLVLGAIVLILRIGTALPIQRAGYMDASYTLHIAENLARRRGFTEEVLWNYLDAPKSLPHPSNLYWMPLPAVLAAGAFLIFGISYHAAQIPFVLLSVFPPLFAFYLARCIFARDDYAWTAGLLTAFSGFYTVFWIAPDNFTPFAATADLALLWIAFALGSDGTRGTGGIQGATGTEGTRETGGRKGTWGNWFVVGILAGLSQLSRADGFLLLVVAPIALILSRRSLFATAQGTLIASLGFLIVLSPWLARNYLVVGSLFAPGGTRTLFLTNYDELFRYNTGDLTLARYLDWGITNILSSKLNALGFDLLVLIGGLQFFLAPFAGIGLWQSRRRIEFKPMLIYLALLLLTMAFVFTFPGMRGSMLHSSIALVAYFAVAVPPGLDAAIHWIARRRRQWNERSAQLFFRGGFVALAGGLSIFLYSQGVFGLFTAQPTIVLSWNARDAEYPAVGSDLDARGASPFQPVLTVDPPSFFNETGRRSIYLPTDNPEAIFQAAQRFGARYLVLENDHPLPLNELYAGHAQVEGLAPVAKFEDAIGRPVILFEVAR
jgi:hypothetical protein